MTAWKLKTAFGDTILLSFSTREGEPKRLIMKVVDGTLARQVVVPGLSPADCRALACELTSAASRMETATPGNHVLLDQGAQEARCEHCGAVSKWAQEEPSLVILDRLVAFMREHRACPAQEGSPR